jgi:hypothetical protein
MDDDEAFMALVLANSQSELLPLERGMHALDTGLSVRTYATAMSMKPGTVQDLMEAAKVAQACRDVPTADLARFTSHLAELHLASSWLWPALVAALIAEGWNVETARAQAGRLKDAPEPPPWADRDAPPTGWRRSWPPSRRSRASATPTPPGFRV